MHHAIALAIFSADGMGLYSPIAASHTTRPSLEKMHILDGLKIVEHEIVCPLASNSKQAGISLPDIFVIFMLVNSAG